MSLITNPITSTVTYSLLYLTVILLWVPFFKKIPLWSSSLFVCLIFGLISQRIDFIGLMFIMICGCLTLCLGNQKMPLSMRVVSAIGLFFLGLGLGLSGLHLLPGFNNLRVLDHVLISRNAIPYNLYLNFDKTLVGIFIVGFLHQRINTKVEWDELFASVIPRTLLIILIVLVCSFYLKFIAFDPKLPRTLPLWATTNLLFVCFAEEAFFRGFIQNYLCLILERVHYGYVLAVIISSILFGLAHFTGGSLYVLLATTAGLGYGWIYWQTQRIEASISAHFTVNLVHFVFFTYPAL